MRKGNRIGPAVLRLMIAVFAVAVLAVVAREIPARRQGGKRKAK